MALTLSGNATDDDSGGIWLYQSFGNTIRIRSSIPVCRK
jgi:hypothetical protein